MTKDELRKDARRKIAALAPDYRSAADKKISQTILDFLQKDETFRGKKISLGAYSPLNSEVDWSACMDESPWPISLPELAGPGLMEFQNGIGQVVVPDVLIIPALAFSKDCIRLGRGGGYYDRYLAKFEGFTIGVAYKVTVYDELPREAHDRQVNMVVCEDKIYLRS